MSGSLAFIWELLLMKYFHYYQLLALSLILFIFQAKAGLDFNREIYSQSEINRIMSEMSEESNSMSIDEFHRLRVEFHRMGNQERFNLGYEELNALERYQRDAYQQIREGLSTGYLDEETEELVKAIDSAFDQGTRYQGTTFRGEGFLEPYLSEIKVGDIVSPSSYVSTSVSKSTAYVFHQGQLSRFELSSARHGIIIPTVRDDELEVILDRNSLFEVTAIDNSEEGLKVIYKEVSPEEVGSKPIKDMHTGEVLSAEEACAF